jgi:hypothetical protein
MLRVITMMGICALLNLTAYGQGNETERNPRNNWNRGQMMETVEIAFFGAYVEKASAKAQTVAKIPEGTGVKAEKITEDGPAGKAGVKTGDLLYKLDDQILINRHQFQVLVANYAVGTIIEVVHYRDGKEMKTKVALGKKKTRRRKRETVAPQAGDIEKMLPPEAKKMLKGMDLGELFKGMENGKAKTIKLPNGGEATILMERSLKQALKDGNLKLEINGQKFGGTKTKKKTKEADDEK